jgi:hypothetical protein
MKKVKGVPHKPKVKVVTTQKIHSVTVKFSSTELRTIHNRAKSMDLSRAEYLRFRGLKPLGRLKESQTKDNDRLILTRDMYDACLSIYQELKEQGHNLNQIARTTNALQLFGAVAPDCIMTLTEIRNINAEIATKVARLGGGG